MAWKPVNTHEYAHTFRISPEPVNKSSATQPQAYVPPPQEGDKPSKSTNVSTFPYRIYHGTLPPPCIPAKGLPPQDKPHTRRRPIPLPPALLPKERFRHNIRCPPRTRYNDRRPCHPGHTTDDKQTASSPVPRACMPANHPVRFLFHHVDGTLHRTAVAKFRRRQAAVRSRRDIPHRIRTNRHTVCRH